MSAPGGVTSERTSVLIFDEPETIAVEVPQGWGWYESEVCRSKRAQNNTYNVEELASGPWMLKHQLITEIQTDKAAQKYILTKGKMNVASHIEEHNRQRKQTELRGVDFTSSVADYSDPFLRKAVSADKDFNQSLVPDQLAYPSPLPTIIYESIDRIGITVLQYRPDQPILYRLITPSTGEGTHFVWAAIYFGGQSLPTGHGQFCLSITGDGGMRLEEYSKDIIAGVRESTFTWKIRGDYRYTDSSQTGGRAFDFRIVPHRTASGDYAIEITTQAVGSIRPRGLFQTMQFPPSGVKKNVYTIKGKQKRLPTEPPVVRYNATGTGYIRLDEPRATRSSHQVSILKYQPYGILEGDVFTTLMGTVRTNFTLSWNAVWYGEGSSIIGKMYDATTDAELTLIGRTDTTAIYAPNHKICHYYVRFFFTSDVTLTYSPIMWGYTVTKPGFRITTGTTPFTSKCKHFSTTGGEADMSHESASVEIEDIKALCPILKSRGLIPVRIKTFYDLSDPTKYSILFQGYTEKNESLRTGNVNTLPAPNWLTYNCTFVSMWERFKETLSFGKYYLYPDPLAPLDPVKGVQQPFKVTDVVRTFLTMMGFDDSQIDVPDSPIRFWPPGAQNDSIVDPLVNLGEWCIRVLGSYLGWYLIWDANAGTHGMARVIKPKIPTYVNLATFVTATPAGKIPSSSLAYGPDKWIGTNVTPAAGFAESNSVASWVRYPDNNFVDVIGTADPDGPSGQPIIVRNWAFNPKSVSMFCNPDGSIINSSDPTDRDYIGRARPKIIPDSLLWGQKAVDYTVRRVYDIACHAIDMVTFTGPLLLVTDLTDTKQTHPRPLRYYDPVMYNGVQYIVRNCNVLPAKDTMQFAYYELQKPNKIYGQ